MSSNWKEKVLEVIRVNDRILRIPITIGDKVLHIISAYAPQMGCQEEEKVVFREELEATVRMVKEEDKVILGADMNGRIGKIRDGYEEVHEVMDLELEMMMENMY